MESQPLPGFDLSTNAPINWGRFFRTLLPSQEELSTDFDDNRPRDVVNMNVHRDPRLPTV